MSRDCYTGDSSSAEQSNVRPETPTETGRTRRKKRSISLERNVETLIVVDQSMVEYYKNEDIENYVLTIMNMVSSCLELNSNIIGSFRGQFVTFL